MNLPPATALLSVLLDLPPGPLELLADRSVYLPSSKCLVLSDTHFGKSAAFRARGLPVPEGDTATDLGRITRLLERCGAEQLLIAGDLLHARVGCAPEVLDQLLPWLQSCSAEITLIEGNHDASCGRNPLGPDWPLVREVTLDGFHLLHDPDEESGNSEGFHLGGHLHPVARIKDGTAAGFRAPVFWWRGNQLVLPAFGSFTGGKTYSFGKGDRLFTALNDRVVELPPAIW
ncbi:MAG: ligase-associated DNA damage response endonuclease PdeM [Verrucomicrobiota bacterium JB023]|nr:ligase-associated DNA damage response endonuclease PdeM [Verrucomicrobiota bacterium JB023]